MSHLQQSVSQLEGANTSTTSTTDEIPFTSTFRGVTREDFPESFLPQLDVLKQEIVSSAEWLARMGYPNIPQILTEHLDKILLATMCRDTLQGHIHNSHTSMLNEALKYAKKFGNFDEKSFPKRVDEAFVQRVVGCT